MNPGGSLRSWGPQPQPASGGRLRGCLMVLGAMSAAGMLLMAFLTYVGYQIDHHPADPHALGRAASQFGNLLVWAAVGAVAFVVVRRRRARQPVGTEHLLPQRLARAADPLAAVQAEATRAGGGAFLGFSPAGAWVAARREHAVLVLGPPRSGKSSSIVGPAVIAHPGPVVSTSTKPDVLAAAGPARYRIGEVWCFDPTGQEDLPAWVRPLRWSPVDAARDWDGALRMARAMTGAVRSLHATDSDAHWTGRAIAALAPLLHAAAISGAGIAEVRVFALREQFDAAGAILEDAGAEAAADVLSRVVHTSERERSSILSTVANVLAVYDAEGPRAAASNPNFSPAGFCTSTDAVFITSPSHGQALAAPLVVGLLDDIRHAAYERARSAALGGQTSSRPLLFALDECANIAPIPDLPALVSEAGGQGLQVMACFQDLSQVRQRWGHEVAEGFLSLFGTKVVPRDVANRSTLESLSVAFGDYDRPMVSQSRTHGWGGKWSTTYSTQRQRVLSPGEIAELPRGCALHIDGVRWSLIQLTPYYAINPWPAVVATARNELNAALAEEAWK